MAPKAKLSDVQPTAEELAEARKVLAAGDRAHKSKMACMAHWLKTHGGTDNEDVTKSRGTDRQKYLEAFLVHQMRTKNSKSSIINEKVASNLDHEFTSNYQWTAETIHKELGAKKGETLRASGKLTFIPCPITGSKEDHMVEWVVPRVLVQKVVTSGNKACLRNEGEGDDNDRAAIASASGAASSGDVLGVAVKQEKLSPEELLKMRVTALKQDPQAQLRKIQDYITDSKRMLANKTPDMRYTETLEADIQKHITSCNKLVKILDKLVSGEAYDAAQLPKLLESIEKAGETHSSIESWASKFGMATKKCKRSRK